MRKLFLSLLLFCSLTGAFCKDGVMADDHDLRIIKTKYFDIIYGPESEQAAAILVQKADGLFDQLAELYSLPRKFRMPVTISHGYQVFNAYFSFAPFNHIVMYDTQPEVDMAIFEETFLNTFRHELTHAVTLNIHNKFWWGVKGVLGQSFNGGALVDTTFMMEGSAVETESRDGQGRTNDEFSMHLVKQAKIEKDFPKFTEVQGAISVYPYATQCYLFGGAFWEWIVKKFGQKKYAEFWYKCNNLQTLTYFMAFRQVFGVPMKKAWDDFYAEFKVPENVKNPEEMDGVNHFSGKKYSGSVDLVKANENGIAFADSDGIYYSEKKSAGGKVTFSKARKILSIQNVTELSFSADGRFLAVSYNSNLGREPKNKVLLFDMMRKTIHHFDDDGVREAGVFYNGGRYYLAVEKAGGKNSGTSRTPQLWIYEVLMTGFESSDGKKSKAGKVYGFSKIFEKSNGFENLIFSPEDGGDGRLYFLFKEGMKYSLWSAGSDKNDEFAIRSEMEFPVGMKVQSLGNALSSENIAFGFTYAQKGTMPRFGKLNKIQNPQEKSRFIMETEESDVSGGIFSPVLLEDNTLVWLGRFYRGSKLFRGEIENLEMGKSVSISSSERKEPFENQQIKPDLSVLNNSRDFRFYDFFRKGTVVPIFSLTESKGINSSATGLESLSGLPVGFTYISGSPWTFPLYGFSCGYDYFSNSGLFTAGIYGITDTGTLNYQVMGTVEFDEKGYKQTHEEVSVTSRISLDRLWYVSLNDDFKFFEGRQNLEKINVEKSYSSIADFFKSLANEDDSQRLFVDNIFSAGIGNVSKTGPGTYEKSGILFTSNFETLYYTRLDGQRDRYYQNLGFDFTFAIPRLLPLRDKNRRLTYNFPVTATAYLFPTANYFAAAGVQLILFSTEIQHTTNFLPFSLLYFNRFTLSAHYTGKFRNHDIENWAIFNVGEYFSDFASGDMTYSDILTLKAQFTFTPNIGGLARSNFALSLTGSLFYRFNVIEDERRVGGKINFELNL